jgi:hypothetical protein
MEKNDETPVVKDEFQTRIAEFLCLLSAVAVSDPNS